MIFSMKPIGVIRSPFKEKETTPIQSSRSEAVGQVIVDPEYSEGLEGIETFSHIILIYAFHCSQGYTLKIKPFLDDQDRGLFTTRYPCRPNPIGISTVEVLKKKNNVIEIQGVDVLDETPLLDIKPYMPEFDIRNGARTGWYETRSKK